MAKRKKKIESRPRIKSTGEYLGWTNRDTSLVADFVLKAARDFLHGATADQKIARFMSLVRADSIAQNTAGLLCMAITGQTILFDDNFQHPDESPAKAKEFEHHAADSFRDVLGVEFQNVDWVQIAQKVIELKAGHGA